MPPTYPPYQQPILERATGRVTTVWHRFFLSLVTGTALTTAIDTAAVGVTAEAISALGYWTPITDGVLPIPELLFDAAGDCVVGFVPTP